MAYIGIRRNNQVRKGGPGSGNFGHAGRPGEVGGSGEGEGSRLSLSSATRYLIETRALEGRVAEARAADRAAGEGNAGGLRQKAEEYRAAAKRVLEEVSNPVFARMSSTSYMLAARDYEKAAGLYASGQTDVADATLQDGLKHMGHAMMWEGRGIKV